MADAGARGRVLTPAEVLALVPQRAPFRFVDEILSIDEERVVAAVRFPEDADFYRGHFPGNQITPGVILVEAMAQAGVVSHGIWLLARERGMEAVQKITTLFTDASVEFGAIVRPGTRVVTTARKESFRLRRLRSRVEMHDEAGTLVASGTLAGLGIVP